METLQMKTTKADLMTQTFNQTSRIKNEKINKSF